ncbi:FAD-binding oxidoreductase [Krasilnikovia sp. MM14-A1004]|uniref:FAD-binding oxidoreductase n=1 Tax=Krasilnikovia sp. MM14-A1004 TaxID=3373541 RepID=UPI00399D188E
MTDNRTTRRRLLGAAGAGGAAALTGLIGTRAAAAADKASTACALPDAVTVGPADSRYVDLVSRGYNKRFVASPDSVRVVHSADQIAAVLQEAVQAGKRVAVRSGGHCFEDLVDNPGTDIIIDISEMKSVCYDPARKAVAVEAGATLGQVYRTLFLNWGVTIPGGICPQVGVGGHVAGGGYGPLSRRDGLVVDYLYAVEVVVVNADGRTQTVVATSDAGDPNRELWWAHTGGGGGNFGVVTRYWFRTPGATPPPAARPLPSAPAKMLSKSVTWSWEHLTEEDFTRLLRNHGAWNAANAGPSAPPLHSGFHINQRVVQPGFITSVELDVQIDASVSGAEGILDAYIAAVGKDVSVTPAITRKVIPWLQFVLGYETNTGDYGRIKNKSSYLRKPWTDAQIATLYRHLTGPLVGGVMSILLYSYGVKINERSSSATATAQRDSIMKAWWSVFWADPNLDAVNVDQIRRAYREVYADTGGVPLPGDRNDGCYINYPDVDLVDPAWNTSGVSAQALYYRDGYARLQAVKARWDPRNVFRHQLSVALPAK